MFHILATTFTVIWLVLRVLAVIVAPTVIVTRIAIAIVRFIRLDAAGRRNWLPARWHRLTWKWLARNLQLAYVDRHLGGIDSPRKQKVNYPKAKFWPDSYGWSVNLKLIPGVKREDVEKSAEHLANRWGAVRLSVSQPKPNRLQLRAMRRDPLIEPVGSGILPPWDCRHLVLGRDDLADDRRVDMANLSGSVIGGNPGRGKTESALTMAVQLVPSPAVELWILDGGACDWAPFAPAAAAYCDDNLADAEELLLELHSQMMNRRRHLEVDGYGRNAWRRGPSESYPLRWLVVEEASAYFDLDAVKGDHAREAKVRACRGLVAQLLRRGRAPMHHTTLIVQKPVGAGGLPPELRDLAGLRWCFGVSTLETGIAALGEDLRQYPTMHPTLLQGPEHVGQAVTLMKSGLLPYTLLKFPAIGEELADKVAAQAAKRRDLVPA
jgi:S-DNA-T family DNA segregation ATPase FtsK/SpoIIIE